MESSPCWILTDALGQTPAKGISWFKWGRGVTHAVWGQGLAGYATDSIHLPYLLDPLYERYGSQAKLWLSEVPEPKYTDSVRVTSNTWTTLEEWQRPAWLAAEAEVRVRLRFAILAAAIAHPREEATMCLRAISLRSIHTATRQAEQICAESREDGSVPQCLCLMAMALRSAAALVSGESHPMDLITRHSPLYTWYAAMAAVSAGTDLSSLADEAVRWECSEVPVPICRREVAVV
ncbi:MAG: hypothetical protein NT049_12805 [Planctomycetota bacterium]|nr:hypothetical protein [Planctomycetota bacterium]